MKTKLNVFGRIFKMVPFICRGISAFWSASMHGTIPLMYLSFLKDGVKYFKRLLGLFGEVVFFL